MMSLSMVHICCFQIQLNTIVYCCTCTFLACKMFNPSFYICGLLIIKPVHNIAIKNSTLLSMSLRLEKISLSIFSCVKNSIERLSENLTPLHLFTS